MVPGHFQQQQSQQSMHNRNSDNNRQHYQTITMAAMFKLGLGGGGGVWRRDNIMEIFHCCHVPILAMGAKHTLMEIRIDMQC